MTRFGKILLFPLSLAFCLQEGSPGDIPGLRRAVEYGRVGGVRLLLDAQIPEGAGPFPAVILVHGGSFARGSRRLTIDRLFAPLSREGIAWFSVD